MAFDLEKREIYSSGNHELTSGDALLAFHLSTQTRGKTTQSVNYTTVTYTIKNTFIFRKNDFIRSLEED